MSATYRITSSRRQYIESHFFEWSFGKPDNFLHDKKDFENLQHPAELHYLAAIYNWDDEAMVLKWILESPHCSRATANLLFWRSLPSYFEKSDFSDPSTCPSYCEAGFALIPAVLERYRRNDFTAVEIAFDPDDEIEDVEVESGTWEVPEGVYDIIQGLEVEVEQ